MKDKSIKIKKTVKCDTRTLPPGAVISEADALTDTLKHRDAVVACAKFLIGLLENQVEEHDKTKVDNIEWFTDGLNKGIDSKEFDEWYKMHVNSERHHLLQSVPEDVNLVDVIEMICDCVSAGMARTGKVFDVEIPAKVLEKAVANTAQLLIDNIEVED